MDIDGLLSSVEEDTGSRINAVEIEFQNKFDSLVKLHNLNARRIDEEQRSKIVKNNSKVYQMRTGMLENDARKEILSFKVSLIDEMKVRWIEAFACSDKYPRFISAVLDKYYTKDFVVVGNRADKVLAELCSSREISMRKGDVGFGLILCGEDIVINKDLSHIVDVCFDSVEWKISEELF